MQLSQDCRTRLRRLFHGNMLFGLVLFLGAVAFTMFGSYENYAAREHVETLLNRLAIGGLLYVVLFWYADLFIKPVICPSHES